MGITEEGFCYKNVTVEGHHYSGGITEERYNFIE